MKKMVVFMLGKDNGVTTLLRKDVPHLLQQHYAAHREDLAPDDACKNT